MRKIYLLVLYFLYFSNILFGQEKFISSYYPQYPKSPTSSQFMRYGEVLNSEATGTNSPEIDLLSIETGKLKFPLVLRYISGNGIRVKDEASNVGLGWSLNLPNIVQTVQDFDDLDRNVLKRMLLDFSTSNGQFPINWPSKSEPTNYRQTPNYETYGYFISTLNYVPLNCSFNNLVSDFIRIDMQPDIFTLNLFGEKIDFIISNFPTYDLTNNTLTFLSLNRSGFKINFINNGFIVVDQQGNKYVFDKVEKIESTIIQGKNYLLSEIKDVNNYIIKLEYEDIQNVKNIPHFSCFLNYTYDGTPEGMNFGGQLPNTFDSTVFGSPINSGFPQKFTLNTNLNGTGQNYMQISKIIFDDGAVNFKVSDRLDMPTKKIDEIILLDKYGKVIKNISFNYDYFTSNYSNGYLTNQNPVDNSMINRLTKRLKLISIKKSGEEAYSFNYNGIPLPQKDSYAVDYWGFFNGGFNNKTFSLNPLDFNYSSNIPVNPNFNDNKKISDINFGVAGILSTIIYPTKGYSKFEYEINSGNNLFSIYDNFKYNQGNGLRLKTIKNYDFNNNQLSHVSYDYFDGKCPSPMQLFKKDYLRTFIRLDRNSTYPAYLGRNASFVSMASSSFTNQFPLSSGTSIFYNKVIKTQYDQSNQFKGKIESYFANTTDVNFYFLDNIRTITLPSLKGNKIDNGKLLQKIVYGTKNDTLQWQKNYYNVKTSEFKYGVSKSIANRYKITLSPLGDLIFSDIHSFGFYPIYGNEIFLEKTEQIDVLNNKKLLTTTNYSYNRNGNLTNEVSILPDGSRKVNSKGYSPEYNIPQLINANIIGSPVYASESTNQGNVAYFTKYDDLSSLNPTSVTRDNQRINGSLTTKDTIVKYTAYDRKGNIVEYRNIADFPTTIIWGYNQTQPIVKIEGIGYNALLAISGASALVNDAITKSNADKDRISEDALIVALNTLRNNSNLSGYQITTYTYDPLIGVTSVTPPSGIMERYFYDTANRLEKVVDVNGNILKEYKYNYKQ